MKTLITTDGSDHAALAMAAAARLLVHMDNHFDTICVFPEFHPAFGSRGSDDFVRRRIDYEVRMRAEAENVLEAACRTLKRERISAGRIVETGSPADMLVERSEGYDVVVAGVRHRAERAGSGLGPVASRLLERASGTVLIGRQLLNDKSFRILVPVDGSAASTNALDVLRSSFTLTDSDITLMHVVEKPWLRLDLEEEWPAEADPDAEPSETTELEALFAGELRSEADEIIETARATFAGWSAGTEALIVEGDPRREILRQAEVGEYDLVVLGATGGSDLKHALLGSVSFRLAADAPCSVAVVR